MNPKVSRRAANLFTANSREILARRWERLKAAVVLQLGCFSGQDIHVSARRTLLSVFGAYPWRKDCDRGESSEHGAGDE